MRGAARRAFAALALLCAMVPAPVLPARSTAVLEAALRDHIATLASDAFAGREPGTEGETLTLRYLADQWFGLGLVSGTNDPANAWFAPVELVRRVPVRSFARFAQAGRPITASADQALVLAHGRRGLLSDAGVVFVGHATDPTPQPELLAGRIALMLEGLPAAAQLAPASERRAKLLDAGAAAIVTILEEGKNLANVRTGPNRASYGLAGVAADGTLEAYLTHEFAARLIGPRFQRLLADARGESFAPVALPISARLEAENREEPFTSHNLIARLPGRGSGSGAVLLVAHWDHLGVCAPLTAEDRICNGAVDNASGLAVMTEIARALARGRPLDRDVYLLATTAEEQGLLGAHAFAENPPLPLDQIVAAINIDSPAMATSGKPLSIVGAGRTHLDAAVAAVARRLKRELVPNLVAESYLNRQDGWALLQRDVPAILVGSGYADPAALARFMAEIYHRPSDEAGPHLDLGGAADDAIFLTALVRYLADGRAYPAGSGSNRRREGRSSATSSRVPG